MAHTNQVCSLEELAREHAQLPTCPPPPGEGDLDQVCVLDKGSKLQQAHVIIGGVPAYGIVDSRADITIMGGDLLKKRNFKVADKIPRAYDQRAHSDWMERWTQISPSVGPQ